jgi:hypothetical protein
MVHCAMDSPENLTKNLPPSGTNNLWYSYDDSQLAIVFVHGVLSDSRGCWLNQEDEDRPVYWPALLATDRRLPPHSVFLGGYYTAIDAGPYEIRNCARELFGALRRPDEQGRPGPLSKPRIVFVCHSTGGIVARYMLYKEREHFEQKRVGLVLIASPSYGARWADRLSMIVTFYNNSLGAQLQWGNWSLEELDSNFKNLVHRRQIPGLHGVEAYENHFILHHRFLPNRSVVVERESAGKYFGEPVMLRSTNHFSAVKPNNLRHPAHELLVEFLLEHFSDVVAPPNSDDSRSNSPSIFHYISSRRISSIYDQLPNAAFVGSERRAYGWIDGARLDTIGDQGNREGPLREAQRKLIVVLDYWSRGRGLPDLSSVLNVDGVRSLDRSGYFRLFGDFKVEPWDPAGRRISLQTTIDGFNIRVTGSIENFLGLSSVGSGGHFEANSLMPGFFNGDFPLSLLAYVQCENIDLNGKRVSCGALCLISNPPRGALIDAA